MQKKRILEVNSVYEVGSTGRIVNQLCNRLKKAGNDYYVLYGRGPVSNDPNSYKIGNIFTVIKNVLVTRIFDIHGLSSKHITKQVVKKIDKFNPDLIHLHNLHGYYIDVEVLFKYIKYRNIPVIWTLHDAWAITGHCACFFDCVKWKSGCIKCQYKTTYPKSIIIDNCYNNWNNKKGIFSNVNKLTIVTPSNWLAEKVRDSYLKDYNVSIINNGIDNSIFFRKRNLLKDRMNLNNKFIILAVANVWNKEKGYEDILELSKIINDDYTIVMIGLNPKQLVNLPDNVIGIERTNNSYELAEYYNMADVFINLTYADNYPTTNLEARACGIPVITYNAGGSSESAGENGIIVQIGDYKEVYKEIINLKNEHNSKENMTSTNIDDISNKKMLDKYMNLIDNILDDIEEEPC